MTTADVTAGDEPTEHDTRTLDTQHGANSETTLQQRRLSKRGAAAIIDGARLHACVPGTGTCNNKKQRFEKSLVPGAGAERDAQIMP